MEATKTQENNSVNIDDLKAQIENEKQMREIAENKVKELNSEIAKIKTAAYEKFINTAYTPPVADKESEKPFTVDDIIKNIKIE